MSKSNPFDLPPPWNPGYEVPQNVTDEGIERRAYTTAWAPRGSFDDPKVGYAGYAVPEYVKEEGYGRGAMTTRWATRGTYFGPKVPHWIDRRTARVVGRKRLPGGATQLKIETMAGVEMGVNRDSSAPITVYGLESAKALIDTVKMMPPADRKRQLKLALNNIDPKLWSQAEAGAEAEAKLGVPADIALERGLGHAMSYGLSTELVALAKGKRPPERSQLGACLPCAAALLGDISSQLAKMQNASMHASVSTPAPADQVFANIGPFLIPVTAGAWRDHRTLSAEKKQYVDEHIAAAAKAGGISTAEMRTGKYPFVKFKAGPTGNESWGLYYEQSGSGMIIAYHKVSSEIAALGEFQESLGLSIGGVVSSVGGALKDAAKAVGGAVLTVLKKVWKGIKWVTMKIVHFVVDAAKWVAKMTCKLTTTPGVVQGAQAVAMAAPNPYTVGIAAGITVTKMICDKVYGSAEEKAAAEAAAQAQAEAAAQAAAQAAADEEQRLRAEATRKKMMPILLLGGAGLAAFLILGKK